MPIDRQIRDAAEGAIKSGQYTRYSLAKGSGVNYRTLERWLDEDRDIRLSNAAKIAEFLGLHIAPKSGNTGR